jgi:hypothetical protein
VTVYLVIALGEEGAVQLAIARLSAAVALTAVGALGGSRVRSIGPTQRNPFQ